MVWISRDCDCFPCDGFGLLLWPFLCSVMCFDLTFWLDLAKDAILNFGCGFSV
jgi:hypothetical protein